MADARTSNPVLQSASTAQRRVRSGSSHVDPSALSSPNGDTKMSHSARRMHASVNDNGHVRRQREHPRAATLHASTAPTHPISLYRRMMHVACICGDRGRLQYPGGRRCWEFTRQKCRKRERPRESTAAAYERGRCRPCASRTTGHAMAGHMPAPQRQPRHPRGTHASPAAICSRRSEIADSQMSMRVLAVRAYRSSATLNS